MNVEELEKKLRDELVGRLVCRPLAEYGQRRNGWHDPDNPGFKGLLFWGVEHMLAFNLGSSVLWDKTMLHFDSRTKQIAWGGTPLDVKVPLLPNNWRFGLFATTNAGRLEQLTRAREVCPNYQFLFIEASVPTQQDRVERIGMVQESPENLWEAGLFGLRQRVYRRIDEFIAHVVHLETAKEAIQEGGEAIRHPMVHEDFWRGSWAHQPTDDVGISYSMAFSADLFPALRDLVEQIETESPSTEEDKPDA